MRAPAGGPAADRVMRRGGGNVRVSTRGDYGIRAMLDLALHYGEGPIPLRAVAERQQLSEHYLEQLMGSLRKANLVTSVRGAQGGYELAAPPQEVRVGDILRALEGPLEPRPVSGTDLDEGPDTVAYYGARVLWRSLAETIQETVDSLTLDMLCREGAREKTRHSAYMYHI